MISVLALDIDGVLTDGKVTFDESGRELKTLSYRDIDAVFVARRQGLQVALITGEDSPLVDVIARRLEIIHIYRGAKDKFQALQLLCSKVGGHLSELCYVGDSARDLEAIVKAGLGLAPADASPAVLAAADRVLQRSGGNGAVAEAVEIVLSMRENAAERNQAIQEQQA